MTSQNSSRAADQTHPEHARPAKLEQDRTLVPFRWRVGHSPNRTPIYFTRNYVFNSPSVAAALVAGRAANGRSEWLVQGHRTTYGKWEAQGIGEVMTSGIGPENSERVSR